MRVVFFGTPHIAASFLEYLHVQGVQVVGAVSKPDKPQGRSKALVPTPVKEVAERFGIPLMQPEKASDHVFVKTLADLNADLFVVVAYGEILRQNVLDLPKLGCINVHASLLPEYRGAAPMQRALIDGKSETGVTIMHMVRKLDAGDIIAQEKIPIPLTMDLEELKGAVIQVGTRLLMDVIRNFDPKRRIPQDEDKVTMAPKVELSECRLDFNQKALTLHNLIRGVGAYFEASIRGVPTIIKVFRSLPISGNPKTPGLFSIVDKKRLLVSCQDGYLELLELQSAGKKRLRASEWISGAPKDFFTQT